MTRTVPSHRTLTNAVVGALRAAGLTVVDGHAPAAVAAPYVAVQAAGALYDGSLGDPDAEATAAYLARCVGTGREQAEWLSDRARAALLDPDALTVEGRRVALVRLDLAGVYGVELDASPPLHVVVDRYRIWTTP